MSFIALPYERDLEGSLKVQSFIYTHYTQIIAHRRYSLNALDVRNEYEAIGRVYGLLTHIHPSYNAGNS